eukprot:CAMPEP_0195650636 /NCGR_PEP_ID=MMETSP0815-20121206/31827_1 /TAXON_ID=97485 /ORGANISM="Prymnesium parvum, Strain Texoma1" /LENGTH=70 /DNA_ID=CAMNT_0040794463 /DNA_START=437 /DNA_END=650 /DNA_ORIENTATION=-
MPATHVRVAGDGGAGGEGGGADGGGGMAYTYAAPAPGQLLSVEALVETPVAQLSSWIAPTASVSPERATE